MKMFSNQIQICHFEMHTLNQIFEEQLMNELSEMGFTLKQRPPDYDYSNGITSSIMIEGDKLIGVSDPRSGDYMSIGISSKK